MILKRDNNESYTRYLKRVVQAVREKTITYDEMGDCLLGEDNVYCHDNLRKMFYALNVIADRLDDDCVITDKELIDEIQKQKDELFKETVKLRDKKREIRNDLRKMARYENLEQVLIEKLGKQTEKIIEKSVDYKPMIDVEASLLVSDIHYGIEINNSVNKYNKDIAEERLWKLFRYAFSYCKLNQVSTLNIELLGDLISGTINVSNRVEQEEDLIEQIIDIADILSKCINYLSKNIPNVNVRCVFGNHSRVNPNKKDNLNRENYERLIFKYIQLKTNGINEFMTSGKEDYLVYSLQDSRIIVCTHGDKDIKSNILTNYNSILGFVPDEIHLGHWHAYEEKDDNSTEIVVNGSVVGTDDYALSIRKNTQPCQILKIYGDNVCTYKIML